MKKHINKLVALLALVIVATSCESDAALTVLASASFPAPITSSVSTIVLTEDTADNTAVIIDWQAVAFPIEAPVLYKVQFDLKANTTGEKAWLNAKTIEAGNDVLSKSFTVRDLNKIAVDLGMLPDVSSELAVRVLAIMDRNIYSSPIELLVTPYIKAEVFGEMYMPGDYQGWAVETAAALPEIEKGLFQGYMTTTGTALAFKLNTERTWAEFYGAGATNEDLVRMDDDNLFLPGAGSFQIKVNLNTLKWSATPYAWGVVGSGTPGSWDNSTPMSYDHQNKVWKVTVDLVPGALKFRLNNNWDINYGQKDSASGIAYLDDQGAYTIDQAGKYEVTFTIVETAAIASDKKTYPATATYTVTKK